MNDSYPTEFLIKLIGRDHSQNHAPWIYMFGERLFERDWLWYDSKHVENNLGKTSVL